MIAFLLSLSFAFPVGMQGEQAVFSMQGLQLKGERFSWNGLALQVDGGVQVDYKDVHIESQHLTIHFTKERELLSMSLLGSVLLVHNDWSGGAEHLQWTKSDALISMSGSAHLSDSNWEFQGEQISFSVETEQVECIADCSARLKPKP